MASVNRWIEIYSKYTAEEKENEKNRLKKDITRAIRITVISIVSFIVIFGLLGNEVSTDNPFLFLLFCVIVFCLLYCPMQWYLLSKLKTILVNSLSLH